MNKPYGGKLIDRYDLPVKTPAYDHEVTVSDVVVSDLYNIADGVFSPLEGFMTAKEFNSVVMKGVFRDLPWTIPILIDVDKAEAIAAGRSKLVGIRNKEGKLFASVEVEDVYAHNKELHAEKVFGTNDKKHPGVNFVHNMKEYLIGGKILVHKRARHFGSYMSPRQTRTMFEKLDLKTIAGFQTRNVLHRAHEYLQRCALELVDGLFLQPIVGWKKPGDFTAEAVIKAYREFIKDYYPRKRIVLGTLKTAMRYAGPKEAVFHAIIRKNFGCTHFIVGRDHAGVGGYYGKYEAHDIFDRIRDLGITILRFKEPLYCSKCDLIVTEKTCGHNKKYHQEISGTLVRSIIKKGDQPKHKIFRPEVYDVLVREFKAHHLFYE
ncbi:MAG: sulfate adenylyltransferase [Candidatus Saganbacteria bacterium]|nr:sulfate adenylyltransferase [Candidatus Saganbacteria bacterium]